jgi:hypothetical protein
MHLKSFLQSIGLCLVIGCGANVLPVLAQHAQVHPTEAITKLKVGQERPLTNMVLLPDLPEYTGRAKLLSGTQSGGTQDVDQCITLVYQAKEDSATIINWYRNVLGMYKWDVGSSTARAVMATNPNTGNSCSIYCDNDGAGGCKLHVTYAFLKKADNSTTQSGGIY